MSPFGILAGLAFTFGVAAASTLTVSPSGFYSGLTVRWRSRTAPSTPTAKPNRRFVLRVERCRAVVQSPSAEEMVAFNSPLIPTSI